jgi:uncharacterized repeat protein (TIGR03803 family)
MKTNLIFRLNWILCASALAMGWRGGAANAQTAHVEVLYSFTAATNGLNPCAELTLASDGNFYGTTDNGGSDNGGTVFKVTTNGVLTTLVSFTGDNGWGPNGLTQGSDGNFYGTTYDGGSNYGGTVFQVTPNGVLTTLVSFTYYNDNGASPLGRLTLGSDGNFYGTTEYSSHDNGTVFQVTTNGVLTTLWLFTGDDGNGVNPEAGLTLGSDGNFYGTTRYGCCGYHGTVFQVTTNGVLTTLASFTNDGTNGAFPDAALTQGSDGNFYGTTPGGSDGVGTVFKVTTNGVLTTLASFTDGGAPEGGLTQGSDGNFYGTTYYGGSYGGLLGYGTVFKVTTNGVLTTLVSFTSDNGSNPRAGLTLGSDGHFYGTTSGGGSGGGGTVFRLDFDSVSPIPLNIQQIGDEVVLSWTNATFGLQSAPVITGDYTNVVGATSPYTNLITGGQNFFRLISN